MRNCGPRKRDRIVISASEQQFMDDIKAIDEKGLCATDKLTQNVLAALRKYGRDVMAKGDNCPCCGRPPLVV